MGQRGWEPLGGEPRVGSEHSTETCPDRVVKKHGLKPGQGLSKTSSRRTGYLGERWGAGERAGLCLHAQGWREAGTGECI